MAAPLTADTPAVAAGDPVPDPVPVLLLLFPLPDDPALAGDSLALLSVAERERAGRFHFPDDRHRFILGRALLRRALAGPEPGRAAALPLETAPGGKPFCPLPGLPRFNLSHTGERGGPHHGLLALAPVELGVDVEWQRPLPDREGMARLVLTPEEAAWLSARPEADRDTGFLRFWTAKEALLKAAGSGLMRDPRHVALGPLPDDGMGGNCPVTLPALPPDHPVSGPWYLHAAMRPAPGLLAALAAAAPVAPRLYPLERDVLAAWVRAGRLPDGLSGGPSYDRLRSGCAR